MCVCVRKGVQSLITLQFTPQQRLPLTLRHKGLTLYQPIMHNIICSHKPIRIYMGGLILGVNTLYKLFSFFKLFPMVGKGLML